MHPSFSQSVYPETRTIRLLVLFGVWFVYFCFGLTSASVAPLIYPISAELGVGNGFMSAILGAWPLTYILAARLTRAPKCQRLFRAQANGAV